MAQGPPERLSRLCWRSLLSQVRWVNRCSQHLRFPLSYKSGHCWVCNSDRKSSGLPMGLRPRLGYRSRATRRQKIEVSAFCSQLLS